jgi:hypothetical protein
VYQGQEQEFLIRDAWRDNVKEIRYKKVAKYFFLFSDNHINHMEPKNYNRSSSEIHRKKDLQLLIYGLFLSLHMATVFRNLIIIQNSISDNHVFMYMYFFLSNLSFVDMCIISTTVPHMLVSIQIQIKAITYESCITHIYCFELFACLDNFFLAVIEYDNFVAICHPCSCYNMSHQLCALLCPGSQMP